MKLTSIYAIVDSAIFSYCECMINTTAANIFWIISSCSAYSLDRLSITLYTFRIVDWAAIRHIESGRDSSSIALFILKILVSGSRMYILYVFKYLICLRIRMDLVRMGNAPVSSMKKNCTVCLFNRKDLKMNDMHRCHQKWSMFIN